jgi:hypothetical protein
MSFKPYYRLGSNAATADFAQSLPLDVRAQRAKHLEELKNGIVSKSWLPRGQMLKPPVKLSKR